MPFKLTDENKLALARFLERRDLKERVLTLFGAAVSEHELKRGELTQSKSATYAVLSEHVEKAISNDWISEQQVVALLDESEVAGRQHVCIYDLPEHGVPGILNALRDPKSQRRASAKLTDFWELPSASYARVLRSTNDEVLVKLVAQRKYWRSEIDLSQSSDDEEWIHRWVETERAAVIVKAIRQSGVVQIRVPPREHLAGSETGKSVYGFAIELLGSHFDIGKNSWFSKLKLFSITDAYNNILDNRDDFVLRHDTPESDTAKSRLSKKGAIRDLEDLRDDEMWQFSDGYARESLRGTWLVSEKQVYSHLNLDNVRLSQSTTVEYARVYFPRLVTDAEVDHVIQRIRDHLQ